MLSGSAPLIGRDAELSHVAAAVAESPSAAVVIAGRAGVGKSRLAAEVANLAAASGRPVANVMATQCGATIPFGAFAPLLPELANLANHPVELIQALCRSIAARAEGGRPLLLVVDDVQLLDASSASLLHQLVLAKACGLVATARTPDVAPDPIVSLWKEGLARRVEIQDLSRRETDALVVSYVGGPVAGSALRWVWDVSAGNPLFVRELLMGAAETGSAYQQDGIWFLRFPMPAPPRLNDLIASRLSTVSPETAEVIDLLALGEPLGLAELVTLSGHEAVEDAERRGLITVREGGTRAEVRLSHAIYREVVGQRIPPVRLRRLSAMLAEAVETAGAGHGDDILRVARWRLDAGDPGDPDLLERAARQAQFARDLPLAARFARAALDAGGGVTAGLVLGETEFATGHLHEAETVLASLVPLCRTDDELSLVANARSYNLGALIGDERAATAVLVEALSSIVEPASRHRLLVRRVINDLFSGRLAAALAGTDELLAGEQVAVGGSGYARAVALALMGRTEEAIATAHGAIEHLRRNLTETASNAMPANLQPPEAQRVGSVIGNLLAGQLATAESEARVGGEVALDRGDKEGRATFSMLLGWVLVEQGLVADALQAFRESTAINRELSDLGVLRWCMAGIVLAEAMAGNERAAAATGSELAALPVHWMVALDPHLVDRAHAWLLIASGQRTAARQALREAANRARATDQFPAEAVLLHDLVRIGEGKAVAERLAELTAEVDGELIPAFAAHATARVTGDPSDLEAVATSFERMGALLLAAETSQAAARAYESQGLARRATALARESARLYKRCGVRQSPLVTAVNSVAPLTRRELEIALLAAPGLSSKAVAERLSVSVRTVDNHLLRVYSKLGVSNRTELAAAMGGAIDDEPSR